MCVVTYLTSVAHHGNVTVTCDVLVNRYHVLRKSSTTWPVALPVPYFWIPRTTKYYQPKFTKMEKNAKNIANFATLG